jgi:hypothetical protein
MQSAQVAMEVKEHLVQVVEVEVQEQQVEPVVEVEMV